MVDLLDEVKDDLQREWWLNFWRRVGGYFVAGSVVIIVVTVITVTMQKINQDNRLESSAAFLAAQEKLSAKSYDEAAMEFETLALQAPKGLAALARLQEARARLRAGKQDEAAAVTKALIADQSLDAGVRDMATLDLAGIWVSAGKDYAEIEALLHPLAENRKSLFASLAKESLAMAALDAGKRAEAEQMLVEVSIDAAASETQRARVKNMLSALTGGKPTQLPTADKAPEAAAADPATPPAAEDAGKPE